MNDPMTKPDAWMPLYVGDYLRDTMHLAREDHGSYLLLLLCYWSSGKPLPDDDNTLKQIARCPDTEWMRSKGVLSRFFEVGGGVWRHKRVDSELAAANETYQRRLRQTERARSNNPCNAPVTAPVTGAVTAPVNTPVTGTQSQSQSQSEAQPQPQREERERRARDFPEIEIPGWGTVAFEATRIGLVEWKARDWFDEMEQTGWKDNKGREVANWRAYLSRVKTWWERDGRPLKPPASARAERGKTPMDIKTIIQAKETKAAGIKNKYCSETAMEQKWSDPQKRKEFITLRREIKALNETLSQMA